MTKQELHEALVQIGLSYDEFACLLGRNIKTVYDFGERSPVPYYARAVLCLIELAGGKKALPLIKIKSPTPGNTEKTP